MNIQLNIPYNTAFGEDLVLNMINSDGSGATSVTPYRMSTVDGRTWTRRLTMDTPHGTAMEYYYSVVRGENNVVRREWTVVPHRLDTASLREDQITVYDRWINIPDDSYLYSSAVTDCLRRRLTGTPVPMQNKATLRLKVRAPQLAGRQRLAVVGSDLHLGAWEPLDAVKMCEHSTNEWVADIDVAMLAGSTFEFKFIAVDVHDNADIDWEEGGNRRIELPQMTEGTAVVYELEDARFSFARLRCAGTQIPLFSLKSEKSFGVGDFGDLKRMIEWMARTKQRVLQLLPINDTTAHHSWRDSYPYNCTSVFALHPQYADLKALPPLADKQKADSFEALRKELNALSQIDYERVNKAKDEYLRLIYAQEGKAMMATEAFRRFFAAEQQWLVPYARYCMLREQYGTPYLEQWKEHPAFDENERAALANPRTSLYKSVAYYYFVQFVLYRQMEQAHHHARTMGVILKGDVPIGVSRHSCDVWQNARYFNLNGQTGAPPDDFSRNGQNWGFPTYNWDEMMKDGCRWWVSRFVNMAKFFDAYRIDHILGFFRIWEIPLSSVHGLLGQFSPSLGMTREEIEAYGFKFDERLYTEPYITAEMLTDLFGSDAEAVIKEYLEPVAEGMFRMKEAYSTQRKVEAAFAGKTTDADAERREKLYSLISCVLFVRDHKDHLKYHPRISAHSDYIYKALKEHDRYLFDRIYHDYYYRRNSQFWYREAMTKLPRIVEATRMLVCAEDLGMVPECVPWVMDELRILSLELQSMPKKYGLRFGILADNPYRSVCTISSHDTPTLRQWWDEDAERTQCYYNTVLGKYGDAPHPLPGWLARDIIARHLMCPSMLCILTLQDWLSIDEHLRLPDADGERINIPANPRHYWRYRMHLTIEQLMADEEYNQNITDLVRAGVRM